MATAPMLDPNTLQQLRQSGMLRPDFTPAPTLRPVNMAQPTVLPTPQMPVAQMTPQLNPGGSSPQLLTDQARLNVLKNSGSGIDQITRPVDAQGNPTGGHQGIGWKILGGLAKVGNIGADLALGAGAGIIPGTDLHHQMLLNRQQGMVNHDLETEQSQAAIQNLNLQPQLKLMGAENAMLKTGGYLQHINDQGQHYSNQDDNRSDQTDAQLAQHGYKKDPQGNIVPMQYGEMSPTLQAIEDLKHAQTEQADATAAMKKAQNDPTSPVFRLAKQRADVAQQNANTALQRLSLYGKSLDLRQQNTNAALYGTDNAGHALPGSAQIVGDDGTPTTVGSKFAPAAIKQQNNIGSFNDLSGSITHTRAALQQFFNEGGSLSDPRIVAAMSDPNSTVGKVINGKLVQNGLSPSAIQAINSVRQLHEQAGILRKTTGGTASEAGAQRILDVVPSAGDANAVALSKLGEQEQVLQRLAPGQTRVKGGLSVQHQAAPQGVQVFTDNGVTYHIPAAQVSEFKKDHPNAR